MGRRWGKIIKAFQYHHIIYQITPLVTLNKKYTNYYLFELIVNYYDEKCLQLKTLLIKQLELKLYVTVQFKIAILK